MAKSFVAGTQDKTFENNFQRYLSELEFLQLLDAHNRYLSERSGGTEKIQTQADADQGVAIAIASRFLPAHPVPDDVTKYLP